MEDPKQIKDDGNSLSQYAMVKLSEPTVKIENNEKLTVIRANLSTSRVFIYAMYFLTVIAFGLLINQWFLLSNMEIGNGTIEIKHATLYISDASKTGELTIDKEFILIKQNGIF